ncbi:MAG TPA: hypothetical protein VFE46_01270 [Pirellulales bacterium]|nr:hypothetical protein [Pirellulales bacterium]
MAAFAYAEDVLAEVLPVAEEVAVVAALKLWVLIMPYALGSFLVESELMRFVLTTVPTPRSVRNGFPDVFDAGVRGLAVSKFTVANGRLASEGTMSSGSWSGEIGRVKSSTSMRRRSGFAADVASLFATDKPLSAWALEAVLTDFVLGV